jgi:hypothetical protein
VTIQVAVEMSREGSRVLEVEGDGSAAAVGAGHLPASEALGYATLRGEIVDPKCFGGTMKPGEGKIHRACAVRCISGGVPPVLVTTSGDASVWYVLTGPHGEAIGREVLDYVADTVEVRGTVVRRGAVLQLAADPSTIRRIE